MKTFELNFLEDYQITDHRLDAYLVGNSEAMLAADGWEEITDQEYEAAIASQHQVLNRVNAMLDSQGISLEFREVDLVDSYDFILTRPGETESEFALRVFV